jgi:hypothetical protein
MRKPHQALILFATGRLAGLGLVGHLRLLPRRPPRSARRARQGALSSKILCCLLGRQGGRELHCFWLRITGPWTDSPPKIAYTHLP